MGELFANTGPIKIALLSSGLAAGAGNKTLGTSAAAPAPLQGGGSFRIVIDKEIMRVTAGAATTTWTVERGIEGTSAEAHAINAEIFHKLTAGGLHQATVDSVEESLRILPSWTPTTVYALEAQVANASSYYLATEAHTSSASFATDFAAGKWRKIGGSGQPAETFSVEGGGPLTTVAEAALMIDFGAPAGSYGLFALRGGTEAEWKASELGGTPTILKKREIGIDTTAKNGRLGDNVHKFYELPVVLGGVSGGITEAETNQRYMKHEGLTEWLVKGAPSAIKQVIGVKSLSPLEFQFETPSSSFNLGEAKKHFILLSTEQELAIEGTPSVTGQTIVWDNVSKKFEFKTISGMTSKQIEELEHTFHLKAPMTALNETSSTGEVFITSGSTVGLWTGFRYLSEGNSTGKISDEIPEFTLLSESPKEVHPDTYLRVTISGVKVQLASGKGGPEQGGRMIIIENAVTAEPSSIKIKGWFATDLTKETEILSEKPEILIFLSQHNSPWAWRLISSSRTSAQLEGLIHKVPQKLVATTASEAALEPLRINENKNSYTGPVEQHLLSGELVFERRGNGEIVFKKRTDAANIVRMAVTQAGEIKFGETTSPVDILQRSRAHVLSVPTIEATGALEGGAAVVSGAYIGTIKSAPTAGTYKTNDWGLEEETGLVWFCTAGGTPGTWIHISGVDPQATQGGFLAHSFPLQTAAGKAAPLAAGIVTLSKIMVPQPVKVSKVCFNIVKGGETLVNCWVTLFNSSGEILGKNATDRSTFWKATGKEEVGITTTSLKAGFVWVGFLVGSAVKLPEFSTSNFGAGGSDLKMLNEWLAKPAEELMAGRAEGSALTLPANFTPANNKAAEKDPYIWVALK